MWGKKEEYLIARSLQKQKHETTRLKLWDSSQHNKGEDPALVTPLMDVHWIELMQCMYGTLHFTTSRGRRGKWWEVTGREGNAILERIAAVVATKWGYATRNCMFKVERRSTRTRKAHRNATHRIAANKEVILKDKSHDCSGGTCTCTVGPWIEATHEHVWIKIWCDFKERRGRAILILNLLIKEVQEAAWSNRFIEDRTCTL